MLTFDPYFLSFSLAERTPDERGLLVAFCGVDGSGKSTMIAKMQDYLGSRGPAPVTVQQPSSLVRSIGLFRRFHDAPEYPKVDYRALLLFTTGDRMMQSDEVIRPALRSGAPVIADRYIFCTLANMMARGYSGDRWIHEIVQRIPKPDLTVFMDVSIPIAQERIRQRPEEKDLYLDLGLMSRVSQAYRRLSDNGWMLRVDSETNSPEECFEQIRAAVSNLCPAHVA